MTRYRPVSVNTSYIVQWTNTCRLKSVCFFLATKGAGSSFDTKAPLLLLLLTDWSIYIEPRMKLCSLPISLFDGEERRPSRVLRD